MGNVFTEVTCFSEICCKPLESSVQVPTTRPRCQSAAEAKLRRAIILQTLAFAWPLELIGQIPHRAAPPPWDEAVGQKQQPCCGLCLFWSGGGVVPLFFLARLLAFSPLQFTHHFPEDTVDRNPCWASLGRTAGSLHSCERWLRPFVPAARHRHHNRLRGWSWSEGKKGYIANITTA